MQSTNESIRISQDFQQHLCTFGYNVLAAESVLRHIPGHDKRLYVKVYQYLFLVLLIYIDEHSVKFSDCSVFR